MGGRNALRLVTLSGLLGVSVCCSLDRTGTGDIDLIGIGGALDAGEDAADGRAEASFGGIFTGGTGGDGIKCSLEIG